MASNKVIIDAAGIEQALRRMAGEIANQAFSPSEIGLIGIQSGGVVLARRLARILSEILGRTIPVGCLDIGMHRDDLNHRGVPTLYPTEIPFDINNKCVILVDDVLYTGRTVRAAMDALNDYGRPRMIKLAVLVDRGHRELPIRPDYVGITIPTKPSDKVHVIVSDSGTDDAVILHEA